MNSNNDLMDPNWKPIEPDTFEKAYNIWYAKFNGCPNHVQVKNFAHDYIKIIEQEKRVLLEAIKKSIARSDDYGDSHCSAPIREARAQVTRETGKE